MMLLQWGLFQFSINTAAYDELQRKTAWRWAAKSPVGAAPVRQYLGAGDDTVTLTGAVFPDWRGGTGQLEAMRNEAAKGLALALTDATGAAWGMFICTSIDETQTAMASDGTPRKQAFTMTLIAA